MGREIKLSGLRGQCCYRDESSQTEKPNFVRELTSPRLTFTLLLFYSHIQAIKRITFRDSFVLKLREVK